MRDPLIGAKGHGTCQRGDGRGGSSHSAPAARSTDESQPLLDRRAPLSFGTRLAYGLPALAQFGFQIPINVLAKKHYVDVLLLKVDDLAIGIAVGCLFDAVLDPVIGWFSDNLRSRYGRRRPIIAVGAVVSAAAMAVLMVPPSYGNVTSLWAHFTFAFMAYHVGCAAEISCPHAPAPPSCVSPRTWRPRGRYALLMIPYISLGYELTDDYDERSTIFATRELLGLCGILLATSLPALVKAAEIGRDQPRSA